MMESRKKPNVNSTCRPGIRFVLCMAALLALPAQADEKPDSYSTRLTILTPGAMPYYRLSIPLQAYLASSHGDLRDLRIFDAAGQPVPHARLAVEGDTEQSVQRRKLPWFPLHASASRHDKADVLGVVVKLGADGTLVKIDSRRDNSDKPRKEAEAPLRGYLLDASKIADRPAVVALELDWEKTGSDFQLLDLESSDDLQHWNSLTSGVQLARLDYNGARIENRRIELHGFRDRYLRLIWREPASAPALTYAELEQSSSRYRSAPLVWSAPMAAGTPGSDLRPGEYRFRLSQPLPLVRLRVELPPGNQLLPLEVLAPGRERRHWRSIGGAVVYRIANQGREWSNSEIPLPGYPLQEFVLRIDPRLSPPARGPQLAFALRPEQIVFLAGGKGPYTLAVGNKDARNAALAPATLVPGFGNPDSPEIANAAIDETARPHAPKASSLFAAPGSASEWNWKKIALWSVLVLGVLGMAAMAWQLLRQMKQSGPEGK